MIAEVTAGIFEECQYLRQLPIGVSPGAWLELAIVEAERHFGKNASMEIDAMSLVFCGGEGELAETKKAGVEVEGAGFGIMTTGYGLLLDSNGLAFDVSELVGRLERLECPVTFEQSCAHGSLIVGGVAEFDGGAVQGDGAECLFQLSDGLVEERGMAAEPCNDQKQRLDEAEGTHRGLISSHSGEERIAVGRHLDLQKSMSLGQVMLLLDQAFVKVTDPVESHSEVQLNRSFVG